MKNVRSLIRGVLPASVSSAYGKKARDRDLLTKYGTRNLKTAYELSFWSSKFEQEGGTLYNSHYQHILMQMAEQDSTEFLAGKVVADFGCGPRGSLEWATAARLRIGIDALADEYTRFGIHEHNMVYVCSTERWIPLPSSYVDVLFTLNAMDHVNDFRAMALEVLRILAPGALFVGSFNMEEQPTEAEPQRLTEDMVNEHLLQNLNVLSIRRAPYGTMKDGGPYRFFDQNPIPQPEPGLPYFMWVKAQKFQA